MIDIYKDYDVWAYLIYRFNPRWALSTNGFNYIVFVFDDLHPQTELIFAFMEEKDG